MFARAQHRKLKIYESLPTAGSDVLFSTLLSMRSPSVKRVGVSLEIAGTVESLGTTFKCAWEAIFSHWLSLLRRPPQSIAWSVGIFDMCLDRSGLHSGGSQLINEAIDEGWSVVVRIPMYWRQLWLCFFEYVHGEWPFRMMQQSLRSDVYKGCSVVVGLRCLRGLQQSVTPSLRGTGRVHTAA